MFDLLIRNALIVDGTGNPGYHADLAVQGDRIAAIGRFPAAQAAAVYDCTGKVLCPGFIDTHVHSELELLNGRHTAGVQMGVTTELICPDGMSFALQSPHVTEDYQRYIFGLYGDHDHEGGFAWWDFAEYLKRFAGRSHNNVVAQAPHGVIRFAVMGWRPGPANGDQVKNMQRAVRQCMEAGAVGLNAGLGYVPASHATEGEMIALCRIVAEFGGVYAAHIRSYTADGLSDAIAETVAIARATGVAVHISHFAGTPEMYAPAETAHAGGVDITWDAYPYMAGCTLLSYGLPADVFSEGTEKFVTELQWGPMRSKLLPYVEKLFPPDSPAYVAFVSRPENRWMEGKRLREAWQTSGKGFIDFYCDLLRGEDLAPLLIYPWTDSPEANEARLRNTLTHPLHMVCTDGIYVGGRAHPRGWGAYPRLLGYYCREKGWLTLEDAIRRMTSFPAARFGLSDRGLLRKGMAADLVVFDPKTIRDQATYESPRLPPVGIDHVVVNGVPVVSYGALTSKRPGVLVRRG